MSGSETPNRQRVLPWAARTITLLAAAYLFIYWIPLLLAFIAWRWHLLGGGLIVVASLAGLIRLASIGSEQWPAYLMLIPFLIGGTLHVAVGLRDRRHDTVLAG